MGCGNLDHGHVVRLKTRVDLELVIVTTIMNVQGILLVEMITVWDPYFPHLRIVVKIHQQLLQPPQPLQQLQLRVNNCLCWFKVYNIIFLDHTA